MGTSEPDWSDWLVQNREIYYDKHGRSLSLMEWAKLFEDPAYRRIAETLIGTRGYEIWVSTVWVGIRLSIRLGPPLIFETMVFSRPEGFALDMDQSRYPTIPDALAGHDQTVSLMLHELGEGQIIEERRSMA